MIFNDSVEEEEIQCGVEDESENEFKEETKDLNFTIIEDLIGKTFDKVVNRNDEVLLFESEEGQSYQFLHHQDCCESVMINDIVGDLEDLMNTPILGAEEAWSQTDTDYESQTWTFYKFRTIKGYVTVRWCGESNGYYSESVDFCKAG